MLVNVIRQPMLKLKAHYGFHDLFLKFHTNYIILVEYQWKLSTNVHISIWTDKKQCDKNSLHVL